jgi:hypothetical protein
MIKMFFGHLIQSALERFEEDVHRTSTLRDPTGTATMALTGLLHHLTMGITEDSHIQCLMHHRDPLTIKMQPTLDHRQRRTTLLTFSIRRQGLDVPKSSM